MATIKDYMVNVGKRFKNEREVILWMDLAKELKKSLIAGDWEKAIARGAYGDVCNAWRLKLPPKKESKDVDVSKIPVPPPEGQVQEDLEVKHAKDMTTPKWMDNLLREIQYSLNLT